MRTFLQIEADGHEHHWRKHCVECGTVETCRCREPKVDVDGICFDCCEKLGIDAKTGRSVAKVASSMGHYFVNADNGKTIRVNSHYDFVFNTTRSDQRSFLELGLTKKDFEFFLSREYRDGDIDGFLQDFNVIRVSCSAYNTMFEANKASLTDMRERVFDFCMDNFSSLGGGGMGMSIEIWHNGRRVMESKWGEMMQGDMRFASGGTQTLWHISNEKFARFDTYKTAQGIIWFAKDVESLQKDLHGASINNRKPIYLYKCDVRMNKTAGWDDYDKYGIGQLTDMGYDSAELSGDVAVFSARNVRILEVREVGMKASTNVGECKVYMPPEQFDLEGKMSVFLAGSIDMGKAEDWQKDLTEYLKDVDCVVLNPRRKDWDSSWKQEMENEKFREQVEWELRGLEECGLIALCLTKDSKAPISLLEMGLHISDGKMIVFCPEGYWRKGNVDIVCERHGVPVLADWKDFKKEVHRRMMFPIDEVRKVASDRDAWRVAARQFVLGMNGMGVESDPVVEALQGMGVQGLSTVAGERDIRWQAVFMIGSPGAGKSHIVARNYLTHSNFKLIDPDEVKRRHPDYDPKRPAELHEWSKEVSDAEFAAIVQGDNGDPVVVDGTGTNFEKIMNKINMAKISGYRTFLVYVWVPFEVAILRNRRRERFVPEAIIVKKYGELDAAFGRIRNIVDQYKVVSNYDASDLKEGIEELKRYPAPQSVRPPRDDRMISSQKVASDEVPLWVAPDFINKLNFGGTGLKAFSGKTPHGVGVWMLNMKTKVYRDQFGWISVDWTINPRLDGRTWVVDSRMSVAPANNGSFANDKFEEFKKVVTISGNNEMAMFGCVAKTITVIPDFDDDGGTINRTIQQHLLDFKDIKAFWKKVGSGGMRMSSETCRFGEIKRGDYFKYMGHIWIRRSGKFGQRVDLITLGRGEVIFNIDEIVEPYEFKSMMSSVFNRLSVGDVCKVNMDEAKSFGGLGFNELQILRKVVKEGGGKVVVKEVRQPPNGMLEGSAYVVANGNPVSAMLGGVYVPWHILMVVGRKAYEYDRVMITTKEKYPRLKENNYFQGTAQEACERIKDMPGLWEVSLDYTCYKLVNGQWKKICEGNVKECLKVLEKLCKQPRYHEMKAGMGDTVPFGSPLRSRRDYGTGKDVESQGLKLPSEDIMTGKTAKTDMTGRQHRVARITYRMVSKV